MKKSYAISFILILITIFSILSSPVKAQDKIISAKIIRVSQAIDRNGNPYGRAFIEEQKSLNGIPYTVQVAVFAFGDKTDQLLAKQKGEVLKAIVSQRTRNGRKSYTLLKILE